MPHDRETQKATCPHCHGACGNGTAYLDHTRRCVHESPENRAFYVLNHRWPKRATIVPKPIQPGLF